MKRLFDRLTGYFTKFELCLWLGSLIFITATHFIFGGEGWLPFINSLVGVTALIFCAKGNPIGQALIIIFSLIYGIISYGFGYFGEMITYLGMTMPMAVFSLISWLRNPYKGNAAEVRVERIKAPEYLLLLALTAAVTVAFYFILGYFGTSNLAVSTLSVATSFAAVYLTFRRIPLYALAYALNDVVLILLWVMASIEDIRYVSVVACFAAFLINDIYGYINWLGMERRQSEN